MPSKGGGRLEGGASPLSSRSNRRLSAIAQLLSISASPLPSGVVRPD
jgi:hypothetical protein